MLPFFCILSHIKNKPLHQSTRVYLLSGFLYKSVTLTPNLESEFLYKGVILAPNLHFAD